MGMSNGKRTMTSSFGVKGLHQDCPTGRDQFRLTSYHKNHKGDNRLPFPYLTRISVDVGRHPSDSL